MKLLVLDVEGTLLRLGSASEGSSTRQTIWQAVARALGPEATEEEIQARKRWENGEFHSYLDWVREAVEIHRRHGLTKDMLSLIVDDAEYSPGALETLSMIDHFKYRPVLISGGLRALAARAQRDLAIEHALASCDYLFGRDGQIESWNLLPCDLKGKVEFVALMLKGYGLADDAWVFMGDGRNDIAIARAAPFSIAYQAHPDLQSVSTYSIADFQDLLSLL